MPQADRALGEAPPDFPQYSFVPAIKLNHGRREAEVRECVSILAPNKWNDLWPLKRESLERPDRQDEQRSCLSGSGCTDLEEFG